MQLPSGPYERHLRPTGELQIHAYASVRRGGRPRKSRGMQSAPVLARKRERRETVLCTCVSGVSGASDLEEKHSVGLHNAPTKEPCEVDDQNENKTPTSSQEFHLTPFISSLRLCVLNFLGMERGILHFESLYNICR